MDYLRAYHENSVYSIHTQKGKWQKSTSDYVTFFTMRRKTCQNDVCLISFYKTLKNEPGKSEDKLSYWQHSSFACIYLATYSLSAMMEKIIDYIFWGNITS